MLGDAIASKKSLILIESIFHICQVWLCGQGDRPSLPPTKLKQKGGELDLFQTLA